ncbi:MAG: hypothetical protein AAF708_14405 [Deinococcota bacterium]
MTNSKIPGYGPSRQPSSPIVATHQIATHQVDACSMLIHEVVLDTPHAPINEAASSSPLRAHHQFVAGPNGTVYSGIVWIAQSAPTPTPTNLQTKAA